MHTIKMGFENIHVPNASSSKLNGSKWFHVKDSEPALHIKIP